MNENEIQSHGANARARGESMFSNPYHQPPRLPGDKEKSPEDWQRLGNLWELGWRMEDMMRG